MSADWQSYREPLRVTVVRTGLVALALGGVLARWWGSVQLWPAASILALWFSFGGHWVELGFLNWLRPRLPARRDVQMGARLGVWFIGGVLLALGMSATASVLRGLPLQGALRWWFGGLAFIGLELVVHFLTFLRGRPSFYNGRG